MSRKHRLLKACLRIVLASAVLMLLLIVFVVASTSGARYAQLSAVPAERVAIVFGAGIRPGGRLTPILADRVNAAVELYRSGRVRKLLMTGDNSRANYDEVTAMRRHAIERGVPPADIALDHAGFRTYDSCYRARAIFGLERAILVTQQYHLPRAVYTCRALGVEAVGYGTPDWGRYNEGLMGRLTLREGLAILKMLWDVHIEQPLPRFLGPKEAILQGP